MRVKKYFILLTVLALLVAAAVFAVYADEPQAEPQGVWCPKCSEYVPEEEWIPWTFTGGTLNAEGHYYLAENFTAQTSEIFIPELKFDCLDLRGNAWITEGIRPLKLSGNLAVFDSVGGGAILATGADQTDGGFAYISGQKAQFDLYSGTIQRIVRDDITLYQGGLFFIDGGTVNLYGGTVSGGVVEGSTDVGRGGNIYMYGGSLTVSGGTLAYGMALLGEKSTAQGGNIYAANGARITISGGAVKGGYSDWDGGNIFVGNAALTLSDTGTITEGHAIRNGGNIAQLDTTAENSVSLLGGEVSGGVAGGTLKDFDADGKIARGGGGGGNYYSYSANGSLTVSNCTVDGDMKFDTIKNVTLSGATKIGLGKANGINVLAGTIMDVSGLTEGAEIYVCAADVFTKPIPEADADRIAGYF